MNYFRNTIYNAKTALNASIGHFPRFRCYLRSQVYRPGYRSECDYVACALTNKTGALRRRLSRFRGDHWPIIFNDYYIPYYDLEMVLYHELAHFMAHEIRPHAPDHGLAWALSCDALHEIIGMDSVTSLEGSTWIHELPQEEQNATFLAESVSNFQEWRQCANHNRNRLTSMLANELGKLTYNRLCSILSACLFSELR